MWKKSDTQAATVEPVNIKKNDKNRFFKKREHYE